MKLGRISVATVSYTHLDVYKRQVLRSLQARLTAPTGGLVAPDFLGPARKQEKEPPVALMEEGSTGAGETLEAVSYTHLDVYKRQAWRSGRMPVGRRPRPR